MISVCRAGQGVTLPEEAHLPSGSTERPMCTVCVSRPHRSEVQNRSVKAGDGRNKAQVVIKLHLRVLLMFSTQNTSVSDIFVELLQSLKV